MLFCKFGHCYNLKKGRTLGYHKNKYCCCQNNVVSCSYSKTSEFQGPDGCGSQTWLSFSHFDGCSWDEDPWDEGAWPLGQVHLWSSGTSFITWSTCFPQPIVNHWNAFILSCNILMVFINLWYQTNPNLETSKALL